MRRDARGNAVSTASAAALDASENALWRMLSFYGMPLDDLDAAIAADPGLGLPQLMQAGFLLNLTEPALVGEAALLDAAARRAAPRRCARARAPRRPAPDRGRRLAGRRDALERCSPDPRDALALQWAHLLDFYRGDRRELCARAAPPLPHWGEADPLHPYVLGLHAFGLEEQRRR